MANCIEPLCIAISQVTACCAFNLSSIDNRNFIALFCLFVLFWFVFVFVVALDFVCLLLFFCFFVCLFASCLFLLFVCLFVCFFARMGDIDHRERTGTQRRNMFFFCLSVRVPDCLSASVSVCWSWLPILTEDSSSLS